MPTPSTYSFTFASTLTGVKAIDSLISGAYWLGENWSPLGPTNLSYSFMAPNTSYFVTNYSPDNEYKALYALTTAQQTAITSALSMWSSVANINFTLTSDTISNVGDLRFGGYQLMDNQTAAWAYFPTNAPSGGDVWIGPQTNDPNPFKGTYDYMTFGHEIGHALGLKHPFDVSSTNTTLLDTALDDVHFTVMSYNNSYSYLPTTPMPLDILAIQSLYGANNLWQTGDNVYTWAADQSIFETIWDAGGNDTIDGSNQLSAVSINLNEGTYSQIGKAFVDYTNMTAVNDGLAIAFGAKIENAIGSVYNDRLTGNALNNVLDGRGGADIMDGGAGNDTYLVDNAGDTVIEQNASPSEIDTVLSWTHYTLSANVENLTLLGADSISAAGNELNNTLIGNAGNNVLDGRGGADTMDGGAGNDTYLVDNYGDKVIESGTSLTEIDTVLSWVDYSLDANVENLTLLGAGNISVAGNELNNTLIGNAGNNVLDGTGGADTMDGGAGNDTYLVDNYGDTVIERGTSLTEIDTVLSWVNYSLGANVENLTLLGAESISVAGNELSNTLIGNIGNNILDGRGGADIMDGGAGNDIYLVDNIGDTVIEHSTSLSEIDTVLASISYSLSANIENLTLLGAESISGVGNELNNTLTGNAGNNVLDGMGGVDIMDGGAGNDMYLVDNIGDTVIEHGTSPAEIDTVFSWINYSLGANVENLTLLGANNTSGIGNELRNTLTGNAGNNVLDGKSGADIMDGGAGNDMYLVDNIGDTVIEHGTSLTEIDTVFSWVNYSLGANVENLTMLGAKNINGAGNELNNTLIGNAGNNTLSGGAGADTLTGGAGIDTFVFRAVNEMGISANRDVITDFNSLQGDKIDLTGFDANLPNAGFDKGFTFIGTADFTGAGQVRFVDHVLSGNVSGGTGTDFEIQLVGVNTFSANDMVA
ncbi:Ca2+-binding RTX toxin-like protein [Pseudomonas sp. 3296]|uniref:M10 family metallopeptidase C-terminal domain-containing protein n=1 Tax=Pseudomonas sp. 3296 TaxID=2817753 RepID=UPI002864851E|nr:matrixin family metalloprotease [Pseudomonas sp. 3296]MDR6916417.1 Ca2+-binding RTX toxin-like protein [Pseudomonas sp. 3296]